MAKHRLFSVRRCHAPLSQVACALVFVANMGLPSAFVAEDNWFERQKRVVLTVEDSRFIALAALELNEVTATEIQKTSYYVAEACKAWPSARPYISDLRGEDAHTNAFVQCAGCEDSAMALCYSWGRREEAPCDD